jgi:Protein of unknown function (DUF3775)
MMGFELRPHDRQVALHPTDPSIADRFLEVIVRLHLEKSLEPDVLEAAGDVLRVLRAEETNRAWKIAVAQAKERAEGPTWKYLLDMELLPDYLEDALSAFGRSCEGLGSADEG